MENCLVTHALLTNRHHLLTHLKMFVEKRDSYSGVYNRTKLQQYSKQNRVGVFIQQLVVPKIHTSQSDNHFQVGHILLLSLIYPKGLKVSGLV